MSSWEMRRSSLLISSRSSALFMQHLWLYEFAINVTDASCPNVLSLFVTQKGSL